jgi:membrane associated rhomboid family serine protease
MIPLRDNQLNPRWPVVTYALIAVNILIFLWDRQWQFTWGAIQSGGTVFADLGMRPKEVLDAIRPGAEKDVFPLATVFTSMFLHANVVHLLGNMTFLLAFGNSVENTIGHARYALYYLFWGVVAAGAHTFVDPGSTIPAIGASGAIGGVLGAYFLLFPGNKIEFVVLPIWFFRGCCSAFGSRGRSSCRSRA